MDENQEIKPRTSTTLKSFIKIGDFLDTPESNPKYLFSNFEIQKGKLIGSGNFSKVYQCKNTFDSKTYAVKVISKSKVTNSNISLDIIKSEIDIHERIIYKDIVRLYSSHEDDKSYYLFMEYIKGTTLDKKITNGNGLNEKEACMYFSQIVSAIHFCHIHRLVFRDIKLDNCLIDTEGNVKLCDFGWCTQITKEHPKRNTICGSYKYMAPEMINEQPYDYAIDIWALGILLYELLHGYSPFKSKESNNEDIIIQILKFKLVINKEISRNCQDLLTKLLNTNHRERITIKEVVNHPWFSDWIVPIVKQTVSQASHIEDTQDKMFYEIINVVQKKNEKGKKDKKPKKNKSVAYKKILGKEGEGKEGDDDYKSPKKKKNSITTNRTIPLQFNALDIVENDQSKVISPIDEKDFILKETIDKVAVQNKNQNKVISNDNLISLLDNLNGTHKSMEKDKVKPVKEDDSDEEIIPKKKTNNKENANRIFSSKNTDLQAKSTMENSFNKRQIDNSNILSERKDHSDYYYNSHQMPPKRIMANNKENNYYNDTNKDLQATISLFSMAEKLRDEGKKEVVKQEQTFWDKFISPFKCGQANDL